MQHPTQTNISKKIGIDELSWNVYEIGIHNLTRPKSESTLNLSIASLESVFQIIYEAIWI